jgi:O-antigen ligase
MTWNGLVEASGERISRGADWGRRAGYFLRRQWPSFIAWALPILAWGATTILLGLLVGVGVVYLPPTGAIGIVAVVALVLLWAMPDLATVPDRSIRISFYLMVVIGLCVPWYYAVQIAGLPWISVRRMATVLLVAPLALAMCASSAVRRQVAERARAAWPLVACAVGFLVMIFLSMPTSVSFSGSLSGSMEAILDWYVPFLAVVFILRSFEQALTLLRVICICAIAVAIAGVIEFRLQHRFFVDIFPAGMLADLMAQNPSFAALVNFTGTRNGAYRANSIFGGSLSFGEFEAMMVPLGLYFVFYGARAWERVLGVAVVVSALLGIYVAGARGGWIALISCVTAFTGLWIVREFKFNKSGFAAPIVAVVGAVAFLGLILSIVFVVRVNHVVLGDGMSTYSDEERRLQWTVGIPKILSNPITGHGFNEGADILMSGGEYDAPTVDSYALSLLLETGVPGFLFFTGMIFWILWDRSMRYLTDPSPQATLSVALACSALAFMVDRLVLSQHENHKLFFILAGITAILAYIEASQAANRVSQKAGPSFKPGHMFSERGHRAKPVL